MENLDGHHLLLLFLYLKQLNGRVTPFEVLQRQLESSVNFEPLETPDSLKTAAETIRPDFLELIQQFPTPERSVRAMGSANTFNQSLIPNNLGQDIVDIGGRTICYCNRTVSYYGSK